MPAPVPLTRLVRGDVEESLHLGSYALARGGAVVEARGDTEKPVYYRSTAKPFQALVLVTSGARERFGLGTAALAIAAGSHNAAPDQLAVVRRMLARAGIDEGLLRCGGHWSINAAEARRQARSFAEDPEPLPAIWSNCSGKHAAMLAAAKAMGAPLEGYLDPGHPVQQSIAASTAAFAGLAPDDLVLGLDGCGAPIIGLPLAEMAVSLARFGAPQDMPEDLRTAAEAVGAAMRARPDLVAGEKRFDSDLMQSCALGVLAKGGAEGVQGVAVPDQALGLAIKVEDGNDRGYKQVVVELLRRRGVLTDEEAAGLAERHGRTVRNWAGTPAGHLEVLV